MPRAFVAAPLSLAICKENLRLAGPPGQHRKPHVFVQGGYLGEGGGGKAAKKLSNWAPRMPEKIYQSLLRNSGDVQEVQEHVQVDVGQGQVRGQVGEVSGVGLDQVNLGPPLIVLQVPGAGQHRQFVVLHRHHPLGPQGRTARARMPVPVPRSNTRRGESISYTRRS